jgi:hypothetical protein
MTQITPKVRFSSLAFAVGEAVWTKYSSGCLRYLQLKAYGISPEFKASYQEVGAKNEDMFAQEIGETVEREAESIWDIGETQIIGRCDFLRRDAEVIELKSINSPNSKKTYIDNGEPSPQNIAQLCGYMMAHGLGQGRLIYTQRDTAGTVLAQRSYLIEVKDDGCIYIDSKDSGWSVGDIVQHAHLQRRYLASDKVAPKPIGTKFAGPCRFCEFRTVCADRKDGSELKSFVEECAKLLPEKIVG